MTVFDYISDILFTKKKNSLTTVDQESEFQPFILNRWLSMYSPDTAKVSNILNKYLSVFESKKDLYSFFVALFPKVPYKKISYFKKNKDKQEKFDDEIITKISNNKEISKREIYSYLEVLNK